MVTITAKGTNMDHSKVSENISSDRPNSPPQIIKLATIDPLLRPAQSLFLMGVVRRVMNSILRCPKVIFVPKKVKSET